MSTTIHTITTEEVRNVLVDMSGPLETSELLTGTPDIQADAALTISDIQINSAVVTINGSSVAIGKAVLFKVTPSTSGRYSIEIVCGTDAGQTIEDKIVLHVLATEH